MSKAKLLMFVVVVALAGGGAFYYYQPAIGKPAPAVADADNAAANGVLVFTSPPRESPEAGERLYGPIAEYLSQATGKRVVYRHPSTWGLYRTEMLNSAYDIIFDGGHFASYRAQNLNYHIVAKMPKLQEFGVIVREDDSAKSVQELAGQTACAPPPPNQGALVLLSQFKDPERQPILVPITSNFWPEVYRGVVEGRCRGGVLVLATYSKLNKGAARVLYRAPPQPNQAWSVSPRVTPEDRAKIAAAIVAPEAAAPTQKLRERFNVGEAFVPANNAEYAALAQLLRNEWGFNN